MNLKDELMLEHLMLQGAVEISGIDSSTGEAIYSITEKLKHVAPEMYKSIEEEFLNNMYRMIYKGPTVMQWKFKYE